MLDTPQIVQTKAVPTAIIQLSVPRSEIRSVMGPGIQELMTTVAAQGIAPAGPWFNRHFNMNPVTFDFEISVPVTRPVKAAGRVRPSELPAVKAVRAVYRGDYEGLGAAWGELERWVATRGLAAAPWIWEVYLTDPAANPDPSTWRTELNQPVEG